MNNTPDHMVKQQGAALITALVLLVLMTLLALSTMTTSSLEERMAANSQESIRAFQAAATGLNMVFNDPEAYNTALTKDNDGTTADLYDKTDTGVGGKAYTATATYNSIYRQVTPPPRGSGWDSRFAFYYFDFIATGSTNSGATSTLHAGAYHVGRAP